jgi:hypothetical protein
LFAKYVLKLAGICGFCNVYNVRNIKLTSEWREYVTHWNNIADCAAAPTKAADMHPTQAQTLISLVSWDVQCVEPPEDHIFLWPLSP